MTTIDPRIQVRLDDDLAGWLAGRAVRMHAGSHNQQARSELSMWRDTLAAELRKIRLTLGQASCIADVCNGWLMQPGISMSVGLVFAECYDAFQVARDTPAPEVSSYGTKWGIDEKELLRYLGTLGPAADHALQDAIARWWEQGLEATVDGFALAGLRVTGT